MDDNRIHPKRPEKVVEDAAIRNNAMRLQGKLQSPLYYKGSYRAPGMLFGCYRALELPLSHDHSIVQSCSISQEQYTRREKENNSKWKLKKT